MSLEAIKGMFEFYGGTLVGLGVIAALILVVILIIKARK